MTLMPIPYQYYYEAEVVKKKKKYYNHALTFPFRWTYILHMQSSDKENYIDGKMSWSHSAKQKMKGIFNFLVSRAPLEPDLTKETVCFLIWNNKMFHYVSKIKIKGNLVSSKPRTKPCPKIL